MLLKCQCQCLVYIRTLDVELDRLREDQPRDAHPNGTKPQVPRSEEQQDVVENNQSEGPPRDQRADVEPKIPADVT